MFNSLFSQRGKFIGNLEAASLVSFVCRFIWKAYNQFYFEGRPLDLNLDISNATSSSLEFIASIHSLTKSSVEFNLPDPGLNKWEVPYSSRIKINCDGSFDYHIFIGVAAVICRDQRGVFIDGFKNIFLALT